jgi:hypothetical protein
MSTHQQRSPPTTPADLPRAKADIKQYSIDHEPNRWADAHMLLAHHYVDEVSGSLGPTRAADKGIEHFEEALKVITEKTHTSRVAIAQYWLAQMYRKRVSGTDTQNLTKALACAQTALRLSKHPSCPLSFAAELHELIGSIYKDDDFESSDSQAANEDLAIRHYLASLQCSSMRDGNFKWANTQLKVGMVYFHRTNGKGRSNVKVAIKHFVESLKVFTKSKHRDDWAKAHRWLALSYGQLVTDFANTSKEACAGAESTLVEKWIASCENALEVFSTTRDAPDW